MGKLRTYRAAIILTLAVCWIQLVQTAEAQCDSWQVLSPPDGSIYDLLVYNGELVASGDNHLPDTIIRWTGTEWVSFGPGLDQSTEMESLAVYQDELIGAGIIYDAR